MRSLSERIYLVRCERDHVRQDRRHRLRGRRKVCRHGNPADGKSARKPKEKVDSGKTGDRQPYFINEYPATKSYSQWERVAYIQLPKAVAYIVFSARDEASYRKNFPALNEVLKSFAYMKVEGDHKQH
jgi:hypothetical protein